MWFTCSSVCRKRSDILPAEARQQTNKQREVRRELAGSGQGKHTASWGNRVVLRIERMNDENRIINYRWIGKGGKAQ